MNNSTSFGGATVTSEKNSPAYGIDLGTTNSCISVVGNSDNPSIIELSSGKVTMPSCVLWDSNKIGTENEFIVGDEAYDQRYKSNACYSVKRLMGSDETIKFVHGGKKITKTPAEVSALILKGLVKKASTVYKDIKDVVITVPADFKTPQVEDTLLAAELAGLNVLNIMKEPTAASLVYKLDKRPGNALVYDLGGGTFDVSVVNIVKGSSGESALLEMLGVDKGKSKDVITVIATKGNSRLGGDDLDKLMFKVVEKKLNNAGCPVSKMKNEDVEKIILKLERLKKIDSFFAFKVKVDLVLKTGVKFKGDVEFTSDEYKDCTRQFFNTTKPYIDDVIKTAKMNINSIVLVGGSTKNAYLRELIEEEYSDVEVYKYLNPDESVSLGAAIQAKRLKFGSDSLEVFDVVSNPIGILADDSVVRLIEKNQAIPFSRQRMFATTIDNQESVSIEIYEGSGLYPSENVYLGNLNVSSIPKGPAGSMGVLVQLGIDSSGLLVCKAKVTDGEWVSVKLVNILGRKVESFNKQSSVKYDRWYKMANSLEEPRKSELINLIEESRVKPYAEQNVSKFINKILEERKKERDANG